MLTCCLAVTAARADTGWGDSPLVYVNTVGIGAGTLTGRVVNAAAVPVTSAVITVNPGAYTAMSGPDGTFTIAAIPPGVGYKLGAAASGYGQIQQPAARLNEGGTPGFMTIVGGPNSVGDITLAACSSGPFQLRPLVTEVNPGVSEIEEGGVGYRYYMVVGPTGAPGCGVPIALREAGTGAPFEQGEDNPPRVGWAGAKCGVSDLGTGVVRLRLPAWAIPSGSSSSSKTLEATLDGLPTGQTFQVTVTRRKYEHTWSQDSGTDLTVKFRWMSNAGAKLGVTHGATAELARAYGAGLANPVSEKITVKRTSGNKIGSFVEPIDWQGMSMLGVVLRPELTVEAGRYSRTISGCGYEFDPAAVDGETACMRLAAMWNYSPAQIETNPIHPLYHLLFERPPLNIDQAWFSSEGGSEIGVSGEVEGALSISGVQIGVGMSASVSAEMGARRLNRRLRHDNIDEAEVGLVSEIKFAIAGELSVGLGRLSASRTLYEQLGIGNYPGEMEQSVIIRSQTNAAYPQEIELKQSMGGSLNVSAFQAVRGYLGDGLDPEENEVLITKSHVQPVTREEWHKVAVAYPLLFETFQSRRDGSSIMSDKQFLEQVTDALGTFEFQQSARVSVHLEALNRRHVTYATKLDVIAGLGATVKGDTSRGRRVLLAEGLVRADGLFPLQWTAGLTGVAPNETSIKTIQEDWADKGRDMVDEAFNSLMSPLLSPDQIIDYFRSHLQIPSSSGLLGKTLRADRLDTPASQFQRVRAYEQDSAGGLRYGIGGIYRFSTDAQPSGPVILTLGYDESEIVGLNESDLRIYRQDDQQSKWQLVGGTVDTTLDTVTASVTALGTFTLAPPLPTGELQFAINPPVVPADGNTTFVAQCTNLTMNTGQPVGDGWAYTVTATGMEIISPDADSTTDGVQIVSAASALNIQFRAPASGGVGTFSVNSVYGDASANGTVAFQDVTPPPAVSGIVLTPGQSRIHVSWSANGMPADVSGYRVYYRQNQSGPPFDGTATVDGQPSPVATVGNSTELRGLTVGSTYYIAVSAVDSSGNEGPLSTAATATTVESAPASPAEVRWEADGVDHYVISWTISEDDGFNDRDVDHYEVYRRVVTSGQRVKAADVAAGMSAFTDSIPNVPQGTQVWYDVVAVDTAGLRSAPGGAFAPADFDFDGVVGPVDLELFMACVSGPSIPYIPGSCQFAADAQGRIPPDIDNDGDVDLSDFGIFQRCYSGASFLADPNCAN